MLAGAGCCSPARARMSTRNTHTAHRTTHNAQRTTYNAHRTTHTAQRTTHERRTQRALTLAHERYTHCRICTHAHTRKHARVHRSQRQKWSHIVSSETRTKLVRWILRRLHGRCKGFDVLVRTVDARTEWSRGGEHAWPMSLRHIDRHKRSSVAARQPRKKTSTAGGMYAIHVRVVSVIECTC